MGRLLALGITALSGVLGAATLVPPALPIDQRQSAQLAPYNSALQIAAARLAAAAGQNPGLGNGTGYARRALQAMPYSQAALALLARAGETPDSAKATNLAAALGWRDTLANVMLVQAALAEDAPAIAAQRIDALGRTRGGEFAARFADLLIAQDGGPETLAERAGFRASALWWITFLRIPPANDAAMAGRLSFARALDPNDGPWRRDIVTAIVGSLPNGQADSAFALWQDTLAQAELQGPVLYDETFRTFQTGQAALGGEWRGAAQSPFAVEPSQSGLRLTPVGREPGTVLSQLFRAQPGRYRLELAGSARAPTFSWQVNCRNIGPILSGEGVEETTEFAIPTDCPFAVLMVVAAGMSTNDEVVSIERIALSRVQ